MKRPVAILMIFCSLSALAQTDRIDSLLNDLVFNENDPLILPEITVKYNFLNTGVNFNSKAYYAGREIGGNIYSITGHVYYYNFRGFFLGSSGNWYSQLAPGYSSTTLTAGLYKAINKSKTLSFRSSYNRFIFYEPDTTYEKPYSNSISAGLSFRKKWFGARISSNFLFGNDYGYSVSSGINSRINFVKFGKSNKIYSMPDLSVFVGAEYISEISTGAQTGSEITEWQKVYGLLNTQLYIPLCISLGDFDFEFAYSINFPATQDKHITYPVSGYYSATLTYMLAIKSN